MATIFESGVVLLAVWLRSNRCLLKMYSSQGEQVLLTRTFMPTMLEAIANPNSAAIPNSRFPGYRLRIDHQPGLPLGLQKGFNTASASERLLPGLSGSPDVVIASVAGLRLPGAPPGPDLAP
jgi:hypothetical protein